MTIKTLAAASLLALTAATAANAADLPYRRAAPAPAFVAVPVFTWTGFYIGANAGYGWGESQTRTSLGGSWGIETPAFRSDWAAASNGRKATFNGFVGGGQVGYNYQVGNWVLGLEVDGGYLDLQKTTRNTSPIGSAPPYTWTRSVSTDWGMTVRPRIGYAYDRALFYATGGLAVAGVEGAWGVAGQNGYMKAGSTSKTLTGYAVGGGVEYAVTSNWSTKIEYLYTDLGKVRYGSGYLPGSTFTAPTFNYTESLRQDVKFHTVKAGLNYKFSTW